MRTISRSLLFVTALLVVALSPGRPEGVRDRLTGRVYEVEEYTEPKEAWLPDRSTPDHWNLWSTEEDALNKRSGGRSLQSPRVERDRATPEEGAPPLHTRITGIPAGTYHVLMNNPNRRIALSRDGKSWEMCEGGREIDLGVATITNGIFELWVDDRYANPTNPGNCYYDYLRFEEWTPPTVSHFAAFRWVDARTRFDGGSPRDGAGSALQLSWITDTPVQTGTVEFGQDGRFPQRTSSLDVGLLRNHRVEAQNVPDGSFQARVRIPFGKTEWVSPIFSFQVGGPVSPVASRALRIPLTVTEPTGAGRRQWPVTAGVPFPQGAFGGAGQASLRDPTGKPVPARCVATQRWPDGSVKWLLVTFLADTQPGAPACYTLMTDLPPDGRTQATDRRRAAPAPGGVPSAPKPPAFCVAFGSNPKTFALFENLALDLNGDGRFSGSEIFTGAPVMGNARLVDAAGKACGLAPGAQLRQTADPLRREGIAEGQYAGPEGGEPFRWRVETTAFAGQPWMRVRFSIANARVKDLLALLESATLRLPLAGEEPLEGSLEGQLFRPVAGASGLELLQDSDRHFRIQGAGGEAEGEHALGFASARRGGKRISIFVKDFWQTYPKGLAIKPDGLHLRLLPALPEDAFAKESGDFETLVRLCGPYEKGKYRIKRGLEFSTEFYVLLEPEANGGNPAELRRYAEWFQHPLYAAAPPETYCASGVVGGVTPSASDAFEEYEQMVERGFERLEDNREKKREYGWMNFGDWYGERHWNWGNGEYDLAWALGLQFLRSSDPRFLWRGDEMARHLVTVDTVHVPWAERMPGIQWEHSVGHVGGFFDPKDERFQVRGTPGGRALVPFANGAIDPGGHVFQGGNFLYAYLLGEPCYLEVAEDVVGHQAAYLTQDFHFSIERAAGWPLINAMDAYEFTGNPYYLNAARLYVERIVAQQDPEIGDFRLSASECPHTPKHVGGKAFAVGVLMFGMMRYHQVTKEPAAAACLVRAAQWLARDAWDPEAHGFRYITGCPNFAKGRSSGGTALLTAPGMAYALTLQPDAPLQVKSVLLDSLQRACQGTPGEGKSYAQCIRQAPYALYLLGRK